MSAKNILVFSGSTRNRSVNTKLAAAAHKAAVDAGAQSTLINLQDYPAAIYNGDDEAANGVPEPMRKLKQLMAQHDGFIVVTPEYNGHVPPLLVNTFSWLSRKEDDNDVSAFAGSKAAIMAASPGRLGGVRVIPRLRDMLAELGVTVVPGFVTLPGAMQAFEDNGNLKEQSNATAVSGQVERLLQAL